MIVKITPPLAILFVSSTLLLPNAAAQWEGETGVGLVRATGNATESSVSGMADLSYAVKPWTHNLLGDYYRSAEEGEPTQDRASIAYKADRELGGAWYGWGAIRYERDEFADIERRWATLLGIGYKFLNSEAHKLGAELGVGRRDSRFVSPRAVSKETVASLGVNYKGKLSETVSLSQRLLVESGEDNTLLSSTSGLTVQMSERLAFNISYSLRKNSDIPGPRGGKTNSLTTVNLLVTF